jgi:curved DNA-binding protein CbpA
MIGNENTGPSATTPGEELVDATDFYDLLGIPTDADADRVESAFRAVVKTAHPDSKAGSERELARTKLKQARSARAVLTDPVCREIYDVVGHDPYLQLPTGEEHKETLLEECRAAVEEVENPSLAVASMGPDPAEDAERETGDRPSIEVVEVGLEPVEYQIRACGDGIAVSVGGNEQSRPRASTGDDAGSHDLDRDRRSRDAHGAESSERTARGVDERPSVRGVAGNADEDRDRDRDWGGASARQTDHPGEESEDPWPASERELQEIRGGRAGYRSGSDGVRRSNGNENLNENGNGNGNENENETGPTVSSRQRARGQVVDLAAYNRLRWLTRLTTASVLLPTVAWVAGTRLPTLGIDVTSTAGAGLFAGVAVVVATVSTARIAAAERPGTYDNQSRADYVSVVRRGWAFAAIGGALAVTAADPAGAWDGTVVLATGGDATPALDGGWLRSSLGPGRVVRTANLALAGLFVVATLLGTSELGRGVSVRGWMACWADGTASPVEAVAWDALAVVPLAVVGWAVVGATLTGSSAALAIGSIPAGLLPVGAITLCAAAGLSVLYRIRGLLPDTIW